MFHYSQSQKSNRVEGNTFDYEHDVVAAILYNHLVICISIMRRSQHFSMNSFIIRWIVNKYKRKYIVDYQRKKALLKRGNQKIIKYHSNVLKIYLDIIRFYIYNKIIWFKIVYKILITFNLQINPVLRRISKSKLFN